MNTIASSRDNTSIVNCFAVHRTEEHIAVRCTKQFAAMLRARCENRAEGFAGVVLMETGNGWYELCSRDALHFRPEVEVDEATAQLFLEFAMIELLDMVGSLDSIVAVSVTPVIEGTLREVRQVHVSGSLSSRPLAPRLTNRRINALMAKYAH